MARRPPTPTREVVLSDPAAVRALAHPARLVVIDALYAGEVLTATECAARAGVTPSAMSYHLRALEKAGLVVRAEARGDGRERPWMRAGDSLHIEVSRDGGSGAAMAAAEMLVVNSLDLDRARLLASMRADAARGLEPTQRGTAYNRDTVVINPDEARELVQAVDRMLAPYRAENRPVHERPADAAPFSVSFLLAREAEPG